MRAFSRLRRHRGRILGLDVAGEVVEVGDGVTEFGQGDRVFGDLSEQGNGGFANHVSTAAIALTRTPDNLSFVDAAALPYAGNLAHQAVFAVAELEPEHRLLVNGARGGVGPLIAQSTSPARSARHDASAFRWRDRSA